MNSRLTSHRNESSPTLFHNGLGSVDPVAVRLGLSRGYQEDAGYDETMSLMAALLHERHHWLQHVGTTAGLYATVLLEMQTSFISQIPLSELRADDLPLIRREDRFRTALTAWERLEATRRFYYGCRPGDLDALMRDGRPPYWTELPALMEPFIGVGLTDPAGFRTIQRIAEKADPPRQEIVRHGGWGLGARHLMEGAARQSEMFRLMAAGLDAYGSFTPPQHFYAGVYGVARAVFGRHVPLDTIAAEVGFAFACDRALNDLAPPLYPFPVTNPGFTFAQITLRLASFRFDRHLDFTDPRAVRALLAELNHHLGAEFARPDEFRREMLNRFLGHLHPDEVAGQLFDLVEGGLPRPKTPAVRMRYELALAAQAERLRATTPELFVFPAAAYLADRASFRAAFDQVAPPLIEYGDSGVIPTRRLPGWPEFFVATGISYELMRSVVMCDAAELASRLAPYLRGLHRRPDGGNIVRDVLRGAFGDGPLATTIGTMTAEAARRTPPG